MIYITHVHMSGGGRHEHIAEVLWMNPENGQTGGNTRDEIIKWILNERGIAKVTDGLRTVAVGIFRVGTTLCLRTHSDNVWTDNLLSLPRY